MYMLMVASCTTDEWFEISPTGKHTPTAKPEPPKNGVKGKVRMGEGLEDFDLLLSNDKFNNFYELYKNGLRSRKFPERLSLEEEASIFFYTIGSTPLNNYLLGKIPSSDYLVAFSKCVRNSLKNLHNPFKGDTYAWYKMNKNDIDKIFVKDELYLSKSFMSSSMSEEFADKFGKINNCNVKVYIKGKTGQYIQEISAHKDEFEVLFDKETLFRVSSIREKNGFYYIYLTQHF